MDHRKRFLCALSGRQPDRVPIFGAVINESIIRRLTKLMGIRPSIDKDKDLSGEMLATIKGSGYIELYCDVLEKLNLDAIFTPFQ